jgi:DNA polymerase-1
MPDELQSQVIEAHQLFKQFGVKTIEQAGYEADDLIGSLAAKFKSERDLAIVILSGDLDMLQLVDGQQVTVQFLKKGVSQTIIYDQSAVEQRYGLKSQQLPDLKGLLGDPSDNIPGVNGIGPKTATPLLQKFGSLENLFENLWELPDKISGKLENQKKAALFSKKLATIVTDIALPYQLADFRQGELASRQLIAYFSKLGFKSLVERLHRRSIVAGDQR